MSEPRGRPQLAVSEPAPPSTTGPAWALEVAEALVDSGAATASAVLLGDAAGEQAYIVYPLVDGRLFVRGLDAIYCYDLRKP